MSSHEPSEKSDEEKRKKIKRIQKEVRSTQVAHSWWDVLDENRALILRATRYLAFFGTLYFILFTLNRSRFFRRYLSIREIPEKIIQSHGTLRGYVTLDPTQKHLTFTHAPFLRELFWFVKPGPQTSFPIRFAGLSPPNSHDFWTELSNRMDGFERFPLYIQIVNKDKDENDSSPSALECILYRRSGLFRKENLAEDLLSSGILVTNMSLETVNASLKNKREKIAVELVEDKHISWPGMRSTDASFNVLQSNRFFSPVIKSYLAKEKAARNASVGVWKHVPSSSFASIVDRMSRISETIKARQHSILSRMMDKLR